MRKGLRDLDYFYWLPRVLAICYILFLAVFALDVFTPGKSFAEYAIALFMHLLPNFFLALILWFAWKNENLGGLLFVGLAAVFWAHFNNPWSINAMLFGPLFIIGILFILHSLFAPTEKEVKNNERINSL